MPQDIKDKDRAAIRTLMAKYEKDISELELQHQYQLANLYMAHHEAICIRAKQFIRELAGLGYKPLDSDDVWNLINSHPPEIPPAPQAPEFPGADS